MELTADQAEATKYFDEKYDLIFASPLSGVEKVKLKDSPPAATRVCRFCGKAEPEITFAKVAHAIPEFLVNKSLISMNECDSCNQYIADHAENDLANWLGVLRTATQMRGKHGVPTYEAKGVKIKMADSGLAISITAPVSDTGLKEGESVDFTLPVETPSQPVTLVNAAKALVKIACSIAPTTELPNLQGAIDWVTGRKPVKLAKFPVLFAFTPGANPYRVGMAMLFRRKLNEPIPYYWCVVATHNVNFQFFVPFCPEDKLEEGHATFTIKLFPSPFDSDSPYGPTSWSLMNWASEERKPVSPRVTFHADKVTKTEPTPAPPDSTA